MFYDRFLELCARKGVTKTKACTDCGISAPASVKWKNGAVPNGETLDKLADYFGVTVGYLLEREPDRPVGMDDFTYAMQNETRDLTDMDKQILLSMARQLNDARKKKDGETGTAQ